MKVKAIKITFVVLLTIICKISFAQSNLDKVVGFEEFVINENFDAQKINIKKGLISEIAPKIKSALITHRKFANENLWIQLFYLDNKLEKIKLLFDNETILKNKIIPILVESFGKQKIEIKNFDTIFYWIGQNKKIYYDKTTSFCKCELTIETLEYNAHEKLIIENNAKLGKDHISAFFGQKEENVKQEENPLKPTTSGYKPAYVPLRSKINPFTKDNVVDKEPALSEKKLVTGDDPNCENIIPSYNYSLNNYLSILNNSGLDVVVKLFKVSETLYQNDNCIRIAFVKNSESFSIANIPEGKYYLKLAYGNVWAQGIVNGKCIGQFKNKASYEKGVEILDYYKIPTEKGYSVPSYRLSLKTATGTGTKFKSTEISEKEFNQ